MARNKHGSAARRSKPHAPRSVNRFAAFAVLINNHEKQIEAAKVAELRERMKQPLDTDQKQSINIAYRIAFDALASGTGQEGDWHVVVCALNIAVVLCERDIGKEFEADIIAAMDAIFRVQMGQQKTGKWALDPIANVSDCRAIEHAFDVHEAQVEIATHAELASALGEVHRRMELGNVYKEAA
jgi:hypothetical protein